MNRLLASALTSAVALALTGCDGAFQDDYTPTPTDVTGDAFEDDFPTPTDTPAPTPVPFESWQRMTSLAIAPEGAGMDLDGDGDLDNGVYHAMEVAQAALIDAVNVATQDAVQQGVLPPAVAPQVVEGATAFITQAMTVDTLNQALAMTVGSQESAIVAAIHGSDQTGALDLWVAGQDDGVPALYYRSGQLSASPFDATGETVTGFGPGELTAPAPPRSGYTGEVTLVWMSPAQANVTVDALAIEGATLGGGVNIGLVMYKTEQLLLELESYLSAVGVDFSTEDAMATMTAAVTSAADMSCYGTPCISVSLTWSATATEVIYDPDGDGIPGVSPSFSYGSVPWPTPIYDAWVDLFEEIIWAILEPILDAIFDSLFGWF